MSSSSLAAALTPPCPRRLDLIVLARNVLPPLDLAGLARLDLARNAPPPLDLAVLAASTSPSLPAPLRASSSSRPVLPRASSSTSPVRAAVPRRPVNVGAGAGMQTTFLA
jgi:hypothetical protein